MAKTLEEISLELSERMRLSLRLWKVAGVNGKTAAAEVFRLARVQMPEGPPPTTCLDRPGRTYYIRGRAAWDRYRDILAMQKPETN